MTVERSDDALQSLPKVLAVDDVQANLRLIEALVEPLECELVLATSGPEALELLAQHEFAVVLLDVQMPGMDGYEVAERARSNARTEKVPLIFLTAARLDTNHVHRGYGSGAVDFLFKPLDPTIVRSKIGVFLDLYVSQQKLANSKRDLERAYEDLKATQAQLIQSVKMASLGELVAGIAHEINNPIAFALSHLGTARKSLSAAEEAPGTAFSEAGQVAWDRANTRLREMNGGLERIRDLVQKLRIFSRLDDGERKTVSMRESVESVLMLLGHRIGDGITVTRSYGEPDLVECYPGLLNQALLNVLANALDAVGAAGTVHVGTGEGEGVYAIRVSDTGPGIPSEIRERVFEPFFTTKQGGQGMGLGLSTCYSILQKHGGDLAIECPPGGGTIVTLSLAVGSGDQQS